MNRIFLLGGHDLEMLEIKKILEQNSEKYIDNNLSWGAKLSQYAEELENIFITYDEIYGIELIEDINNKKIKIIDHHSDNLNKPTAIEQVAEIINVELTRKQKLIAINDKSYIDGMKDFGATSDEINEIRRLDRKCQGVTEEDEILAEKSIKENLKSYGEIITIKSLTSRFSPICDRLYPYNHLIIYTENELNYYGNKVKDIYEMYKNTHEKDMYYGSGYLGFSEGSLTKESVLIKVGEIVDRIRS